jgi:hypothetical protein
VIVPGYPGKSRKRYDLPKVADPNANIQITVLKLDAPVDAANGESRAVFAVTSTEGVMRNLWAAEPIEEVIGRAEWALVVRVALQSE